ncbi:hypothetical protein PHLGIDRAFT_104576 [Phlebiopsis gigantea 11061_1 CR5-6]|uniref:BRO1 domain-containing protein n=1 Tax=Phlebiopsis gigantea (strain 11061_1 CR5-6) TaxID=745531 RepID=A0A0C3PN55_PHLG1|nr:hypothetical protein PHLGIDRAFT_104576 [Phlebiopsis gigantea 11061_1 CR5-6]
MPNLLTIPFKKTFDVPIKQRVRDYISQYHTDVHPDALKWDISRWEALRKDGVGGVVHVDRVKASTVYHAQLVFILTKLPLDIGLDIPYAPVFNSAAPPMTLRNLAYERASVLFNLAALYSQLAAGQDRSTPQGLKQMIAYYQSAAGSLHQLATSAAPKFLSSIPDGISATEFSGAFIESLQSLMLAQAQEGVWQRAVIDSYKNGVIAKLATKVASFYNASLRAITEAEPSVRQLFSAGWLAHLETKQYHFEGVAQYRKSLDDSSAGRYGEEVARLTLANMVVKSGYEIARRNAVAPAVLQDIKSLLDTVQQTLTTAERDNDLIYHQVVPSASTLLAISEVSMVQPMIPGGVADPRTALGNDAVIFGELLGHGARVAIELYQDRRKNWIEEEITDRARLLDDDSTSTLRSLNLPAALEALEKPVGLPPSLLKKAEEVRQEDGPAKIETSINDVQKLAERNLGLLNEALDLLDQEAEEDEVFQEDAPSVRQPSSEANRDLVAKAQRYRGILDGGMQSDTTVRQKWDEWQRFIVQLTWSNEELEGAVPSSTVSLTSGKLGSRSPNSTQAHARQLRVLLESLDDIQRSRNQLVSRATRLAASEDITPRILKAASAIERWVEVHPSMFEDVIDDELSKYDKFREEIEEGEQQQEVLLDSIKERNALFLQSRKEDPSVKEREHALQSLDLAYHKYREISRNLDEGLKFYNDIGDILARLRQDCREWCNYRRDEMNSLLRSMQSMSLGSDAAETPIAASSSERIVPDNHSDNDSLEAPEAHSPESPSSGPSPPSATHASSARAAPSPAPQPAPQPTPHRRHPRTIIDLPPPDSDEWEAAVLPPPPPPSVKKKAPASKRSR